MIYLTILVLLVTFLSGCGSFEEFSEYSTSSRRNIKSHVRRNPFEDKGSTRKLDIKDSNGVSGSFGNENFAYTENRAKIRPFIKKSNISNARNVNNTSNVKNVSHKFSQSSFHKLNRHGKNSKKNIERISDDSVIIMDDASNVVKVYESKSSDAPLNSNSNSNSSSHNTQIRSNRSYRAGDSYHEVTLGDTIPGIANKYGLCSEDIINANGIMPPYRIFLGQLLTIPRKNKSRDKSCGLNEIKKNVKVFENFKMEKMNFKNEYYPWDYDLLDSFDVVLALNFRENMKKLKNIFTKNFADAMDLDAKSDGIFIKFVKKDSGKYSKNGAKKQNRKFAVEENDGFANKKDVKKMYVHSMTSGKVVLINKTEEFGIIVVVDSGAGKFIIYGYLSSVFVKKGDFINMGDSFASISHGMFSMPVLFLGVYRIEKGNRVFINPMECFSYLRRFFNERNKAN